MRSTTPEKLEKCKSVHPVDMGFPVLDPLPEVEVTPELLAANAATYAARAAHLRSELGWEPLRA